MTEIPHIWGSGIYWKFICQFEALEILIEIKEVQNAPNQRQIKSNSYAPETENKEIVCVPNSVLIMGLLFYDDHITLNQRPLKYIYYIISIE